MADLFVFVFQIENVEACLNFLGARGVSVQGLSAEGKTSLSALNKINPFIYTHRPAILMIGGVCISIIATLLLIYRINGFSLSPTLSITF